MAMTLMCAAAGTATAGPQFAALDFVSVNPVSGSSITPTGEGSSTVGLTGDLGPFFPGVFSVSFGLTFDSFSVNGDGVAALLSFQPTFASGQLAVTSVTIAANLFDGADPVSTMSAPGEVANGSSLDQAFDVLGVAHSFSRSGAGAFEYIGDHGTIQVTLEFAWTGAQNGHTLGLELVDGSEVSYLAFIPAPGVATVMALGGVVGLRRRRA